MAENIVVGAGLSGLVAAINLTREGREVLVLERESRVGGSSIYHPSLEGTPVDLGGLTAFTGIDIGPTASRFQAGRAVVYGEMIPVDMDSISSRMIERGPRSGSLDSYLYRNAVKAGVKFEFNHPVLSHDEIAKLPPDTIIATGLYFEGFDALRIPYVTSFHYIARQAIEDTETNHVTVYFGGFTSNYGYTCSANGLRMSHLFQRSPLGRDSLQAFKEQVYVSEGIGFDEWAQFTFPLPAATILNPRLFAGDKILAGTLAGCMESYMNFGILGALVSGKIAATAVTDKGRAYDEFMLATGAFRGAYLLRKASDLTPHMLRGTGLRFGIGRLFKAPAVTRMMRRSIPGWLNCEKAGSKPR